MIKVENLSKFYGDVKAVKSINFELNDGEIVEQGSHLELLKKDGAYKNLYDMQFSV